MRTCVLAPVCCAALLLSGADPSGPRLYAQTATAYDRGQDISPTYDGWEQNADGTYSLYFGYFNRNTDEEIDVPVGPNNAFDGGVADRGQPTHFYPNRKWWVYAARDPSLMTNGTNETDLDHENRPPVITGSAAQTVNVSDTLSLSVTANDDGHPKPIPDPTGRLQQGVRVRWIVYRGVGKVQFTPDIMNQRVYGKPATLETKVRFAVPGMYRLRAIASDGQTFSTYDVDVTVK